MRPEGILKGKTLVAGNASGEAVVLEEPISFWGGVDPSEGIVVSERHPQYGAVLRGRVLVMPSGRGSSSSSSVLLEAIRLGTAPVGIVLREPDPIVVLGVVVAEELYGMGIPVVVLSEEDYAALRPGLHVALRAQGDPATVDLCPSSKRRLT
jgi:predicted aconitase with swiveling domain